MSEPRVERVDFRGRPAWRKRYGEAERRRRIALLRWVARRLGANSLVAPMPLSGEAACRTEREMIERLGALGVPVPEILDAGTDALVLSDLGPTLALRCKQEPDPVAREALLRDGFNALLALHERGGYLSQAFARNMAVSGQGIGFIDLEEDPREVMSLPAAQARDVLFFVHSTVRFLADRPRRYARLLRAHIVREPDDVRHEIRRAARAFGWLAPLARLGGERGRALAMALRMLARMALVPLWSAGFIEGDLAAFALAGLMV